LAKRHTHIFWDIYVCRIYSFYHYTFPGAFRCQLGCPQYRWNLRYLKIECL